MQYILAALLFLSGCEQHWRCYHAGELIAEGASSYRQPLPEWHGEGYTKLPNGKVIEGVCAW